MFWDLTQAVSMFQNPLLLQYDVAQFQTCLSVRDLRTLAVRERKHCTVPTVHAKQSDTPETIETIANPH